jgi:hypothetical protein
MNAIQEALGTRCARCGELLDDREPRHKVTRSGVELFYHAARPGEPRKACSAAAVAQYRKGSSITLIPPTRRSTQKVVHRKDHDKQHKSTRTLKFKE